MESKQAVPTAELDKAIKKIEAEVREGVSHGHFEFGVSCSIGNNGKRELFVKAGKSYKFLIPAPEPKQAA